MQTSVCSAFAGYRSNLLYLCGARVKKITLVEYRSDHTDGKTVTIIIVHSQGNHSHTMLWGFYLSKIPSEVKQATNHFYLNPLPFTSTGVCPWFQNSPLGTKKLQTMVKDIMEEAKIPGKFTNHSLRVTGKTTPLNLMQVLQRP